MAPDDDLTPIDRYVMLSIPERLAVREAICSMSLDSLPDEQRHVAEAMLEAYGICNAKYASALWLNWGE